MTEAEKKMGIDRVYVKQASIECYGVPEIFKKEWKPETSFEMRMNQKRFNETDNYEVSITLELKIKVSDQLVCIIKVEQAGTCLIQGFKEDELKYLQSAVIPSQLFPHATHKIYELMTFASLPAMVLPPINFDAVYHKQQEEEKKRKEDKEKVIKKDLN